MLYSIKEIIDWVNNNPIAPITLHFKYPHYSPCFTLYKTATEYYIKFEIVFYETIFQIYGNEITPSDGDLMDHPLLLLYKDEPLVLDLYNLLIDRHSELTGVADNSSHSQRGRQYIILALL